MTRQETLTLCQQVVCRLSGDLDLLFDLGDQGLKDAVEGLLSILPEPTGFSVRTSGSPRFSIYKFKASEYEGAIAKARELVEAGAGDGDLHIALWASAPGPLEWVVARFK